MKQFRSPREFGIMPESIVKFLNTCFSAEYLEDDFEYSLGGDVFIIETPEELSKIPIGESNATNTIEVIDVVEDLEDYVLFATVETDLGGRSFFVPKEIYEQSILLKLIFEASNTYWSKVREDNQRNS